MPFKLFTKFVIGLSLGLLSISGVSSQDVEPKPVSLKKSQSDIITTLRRKKRLSIVSRALEQCPELKSELESKGPFTIFVSDDRGWKSIDSKKREDLLADAKSFERTFKYGAVKGENLDFDQLFRVHELKSLDGSSIEVRQTAGEKEQGFVFVNESRIEQPDIRCSNGIIHILDVPLIH